MVIFYLDHHSATITESIFLKEQQVGDALHFIGQGGQLPPTRHYTRNGDWSLDCLEARSPQILTSLCVPLSSVDSVTWTPF